MFVLQSLHRLSLITYYTKKKNNPRQKEWDSRKKGEQHIKHFEKVKGP